MFKLDYRTGRKLVWGTAAIVFLYVDVTADGGISFWDLHMRMLKELNRIMRKR